MNGFQQVLERITDPDLRARIQREERMAEALIDACLARGYTISVNDGEGWVVVRSKDKSKIMAEMFAADEDTLMIRRAKNRTKVGWFQFIYGNDGWDVIADYSANEICDEIWNTSIEPLVDSLSAGDVEPRVDVKETLQLAESFISGFEGDPLQEGVDEILVKIRGAIAKVDA